MTAPKMILFDYGGTLLYEPEFDPKKGNEALFRLIKDNPNNITVEEFTEYLTALFEEIRQLRSDLIEIHEHHFLRYLLEYFGITLAVPVEYAELEMFNAITQPRITPGADIMLSELSKLGIRTGIISNLCWSGEALTSRICQFFPDHRFEFIMTSSDYIFRKPDRHLFELAVRKSGLTADEIWFCGNDTAVDVIGAHRSGLFPVFYADKSFSQMHKISTDESAIDFTYLKVNSWDDFVLKLKETL